MALKVVGKAKLAEAKPAKKKLKVVAEEAHDEEPEDEPEVEEPKAEVKKPKKTKEEALSPVKVKAEVMDSGTLIEEARVAYRAFQTSWFDFAKKLKEIRDTEAWIARGFDDFTALCKEEFPEVPAAVISKFIKVVDEFGAAIEARSKSQKALPAYEALYVVAVNEKNIPKEDAMRLRKAVIDGKVSIREVREVVRGFVAKKDTKHAEGRSEKRKARNEEIGIKSVEVEDATESVDDVEVNEDEEISTSIDKDAEIALKFIRQLISRIPAITESMSEGTNKLIELAEASEQLQVHFNDYLDRLETVSNL